MRTYEHLIERGIPVVLWGRPGCGKTARIAAYAAQRSWPLFVCILSHYDPVELHGIITLDKRGDAHRGMPDWAGPELFSQEQDSILFLDELSTASPAQQAAALRIVAERMVGSRRLSPGCRIIAAANPPECSAGGAELAAPTANRFAHLNAELDNEEFLEGFPGMFSNSVSFSPSAPLPTEQETLLTRASIAAFLRRAPQYIHSLPNDPIQAGQAWPSPRTWDLCARAIAGVRDSGLRLALAAACIGEAAATELCAYLEELDIPSPEDIVNGKPIPIPPRGDILFTAAVSAAELAIARGKADGVRNVWAWLGEAAKSGQAEAAALAARTLIHRAAGVYLPLGKDANLLEPFRPLIQRN